jgi:SAM-dependent methyltransferase
MDSQKTATYYGNYYFAHCCGRPYQRDEEWMRFFRSIAERIVIDICPNTILDAGCAMGFLVEALREKGVEAWGVDISEYAIQKAHAAIQPYCWVGSITKAFPRKYDLIVCIEVLEHLPPQEVEHVIANLCQHTDDILFSSTPLDYKEATHFNVQPPEYWAEQFAKQGFVRDVDFDASFITTWAARFRRNHEPLHRVLRAYERRFWLLWKENQDIRSSTVDLYNQLATGEQSVQKLSAQVVDLQSQMQQSQVELERSQLQLQEKKTELERSQSQLQHTQAELERSQSQLQHTQAELQQAQAELQQAQATIAGIQTSKFWKLRTAWFNLKKVIGIVTDG